MAIKSPAAKSSRALCFDSPGIVEQLDEQDLREQVRQGPIARLEWREPASHARTAHWFRHRESMSDFGKILAG